VRAKGRPTMKRRATAAASPKTVAKRNVRSGAVKTVAMAASVLQAASGAPDAACVLDLGPGLVEAVVIGRPSSRNRSPYVGDVRLGCGRIAIAHMPSMDMGGKCFPGAKCLLKLATDKKGQPIGADAVGKFGTPKCEYIMQLLRVDEAENEHLGGCWIGAHPSLGERIASELLRSGQLAVDLGGTPAAIEREVTGVAGTDMRCDFLLSFAPSAPRTVVEIKTVVDTDYHPATAPERKGCVFVGQAEGYQRCAIFPWGKSNQRGPEGEKVVSERAIKHVRELTALATGQRQGEGGERFNAAVLFIAVRGDALRFRANAEACPSFARYLRAAKEAGVAVLAHRVRWGEGSDLGRAFYDGPLPVDL